MGFPGLSKPDIGFLIEPTRKSCVTASISESERAALDDVAHECRCSISVLLRCAAVHAAANMTHRELLNILDMNRVNTRTLLERHNAKHDTDLRYSDRVPMDAA